METITINYTTKLGNFTTIFTTDSGDYILHPNQVLIYTKLDSQTWSSDLESIDLEDVNSRVELLKEELNSRGVVFTCN